MEKISRSCGTHDGTFHADEVTACALLELFNLIDADKIIRTRDSKQLAHCEFVCDVGGVYAPADKLFDHHQADYDGPLSSAGMILLYLRESGIISSNDYNFYNNALILGVDAHDNGRDPMIKGLCTYSHLISNFTPINHECSAETLYKAFMDAFYFARDHLSRLKRRHQYIVSCREVVARKMDENKDHLCFDHAMPWMESFFELNGLNHPAKFVIMPSGKHWKLRGIPPSMDNSMKVRMPLPEEWAGLLEEDLRRISGIPGAVFCHKGRFISVWETRDDAIKALHYVLNNAKEQQT